MVLVEESFFNRNYFIDDPIVHSDYFNLLAPKAVSYGAGAIDLFFKEADIMGSNSYKVDDTTDDFVEALKLISQNATKFSKLITHILPLKDFNKSLLLVKNRKETSAIKIIFKP